MTNTFETDISNANFNSAQYYIDDDGSFKFVSPILASSNFDGSVPIFEGEIDAEDLNTGMLIQLDDDQFYGILQIFKDDPDLEDDPSTEITIQYLDSNNESQTITYDFLDTVTVRYEDWDEKYLGTQGWALTYGGNAIFANVGVRGRIEATEGEIEGNLIVSGGLFTSEDAETSGGIVLNNSGFTAYNTSGSTTFNIDAETGTVTIGGYATLEDVESSSAYFETLIDDLNDRISASISDLSIDLNSLSASVDFLYDAGFVTDNDLVTTGGTTINGNNITTGIINANLVNVSSGLTGNRGIKINSLGLTAYNSSQQPTFNINSETGAVTIGSNNALDYITGTQLSTAGQTTINGGNITTGTINASLATITNINASNITTGSLSGDRITGGTIIGSSIRTSAGNTRVQLDSGDAGSAAFYYFGTLRGLILGADAGLSLFGTNLTTSWNNFRVVGNIETTVSGTKITPSSFNNAQTPLQIRTSDNLIGVQSSTINIKENIIPLIGNQSIVVPEEKDGIHKDSLIINPDNIFEITPVQYSIVGKDPNVKEIGFIVEDLLQTWPCAVTYNSKNKPISYNTNSIVAGLIYAVKKQKSTIEKLEKRIIALETEKQ